MFSHVLPESTFLDPVTIVETQMYRHGVNVMGLQRQPWEIDVVIFDLDGTLADTVPIIVRAFQATFDDFGLPARTQYEIRAHFGPTEDGVIRAMFGSVADAAIPVFYEIYQEMLSGTIESFRGIRGLIEELAANAYRLAVVTGKSDRGAAITLEALGFEGVFGTVRGGSDLGIVKAAVIGDLVDKWNISPERAVYIGDDPLDVAEARKAGVGALAAGWASTVDLPAIRAAEPDELFLSVDELAIWLRIDETKEKGI